MGKTHTGTLFKNYSNTWWCIPEIPVLRKPYGELRLGFSKILSFSKERNERTEKVRREERRKERTRKEQKGKIKKQSNMAAE